MHHLATIAASVLVTRNTQYLAVIETVCSVSTNCHLVMRVPFLALCRVSRVEFLVAASCVTTA